MRRIFAAAALALAACDPGAGVDGYSFDRREVDHPIVTVTRIEHRSVAELNAAATTAGARIESGREAFAFATLQPDRATCTIHFVRPETAWHPEALGHELAHCFYGRWHP